MAGRPAVCASAPMRLGSHARPRSQADRVGARALEWPDLCSPMIRPVTKRALSCRRRRSRRRRRRRMMMTATTTKRRGSFENPSRGWRARARNNIFPFIWPNTCDKLVCFIQTHAPRARAGAHLRSTKRGAGNSSCRVEAAGGKKRGARQRGSDRATRRVAPRNPFGPGSRAEPGQSS